MSYLAKPRSAVRVDLLVFNTVSSLSAGTVFTVNDTPKNTSATINASGYIELHNNSSWRIEANCLCQFSTTNSNYEAVVYWYDGTSNLGNRGRMSNLSDSEISRGTCSLLILSSEISTSITLYPRIDSVAGAPGYDPTFSALPHVRIYEIPN